jgi:Cu-Zn family superoxide dismutase
MMAKSNNRRNLTIVAATKKAVAVLKGTSNVEGVINLIQEDDGRSWIFHTFLSG